MMGGRNAPSEPNQPATQTSVSSSQRVDQSRRVQGVNTPQDYEKFTGLTVDRPLQSYLAKGDLFRFESGPDGTRIEFVRSVDGSVSVIHSTIAADSDRHSDDGWKKFFQGMVVEPFATAVMEEAARQVMKRLSKRAGASETTETNDSFAPLSTDVTERSRQRDNLVSSISLIQVLARLPHVSDPDDEEIYRAAEEHLFKRLVASGYPATDAAKLAHIACGQVRSHADGR
jgi:hypothetical protein